MGWRQLESGRLGFRSCFRAAANPSLVRFIAAGNSFCHSRPRQHWKIRLSGRQAAWYRQINSLQGYQKRSSVIHVPPSFPLSVNLHTNLPIRPFINHPNKGWLKLQWTRKEVFSSFSNHPNKGWLKLQWTRKEVFSSFSNHPNKGWLKPSLANRRRRNRNHPVQQDKKSSICEPFAPLPV